MIAKRKAAFSILILLACVSAAAATNSAQPRIVTDMVGRRMTVPQQINKVYCMNPACAILVYTLAPDKLVGWPIPLSKKAQSFIAEPYRQLPAVGSLQSRSANVEEVLRTRPDVLMMLTTVHDTQAAEKMQEQTHIPLYILDIGLRNLPKTYESLGRLLGAESRAAQLSEYCRKSLEDVDRQVRKIPPEKRRRVYYAFGVNGLETAPEGSLFSEPIDIAGGLNVAQVSFGPANQVSLGPANITSTVSREQILKWNPEVVISAYNFSSHAVIWQDPLWAHVRALKSHAVYEMPRYPFAWDRPFSAARILEIKWLATLFYPDLFHYNIRQETQNFYATFYHYKPTEAELDELLSYSLR